MAARTLAVIGSPISHSKSPAIHAAAYRVLKLDWSYSAIEIEQGQLAGFLDGLDDTWLGLSVTAPLKEEASEFAAGSLERALGSANTLVRTPSGWQAFNTDVFGSAPIRAVPSSWIDHPGVSTSRSTLTISNPACSNISCAVAAMSAHIARSLSPNL